MWISEATVLTLVAHKTRPLTRVNIWPAGRSTIWGRVCTHPAHPTPVPHTHTNVHTPATLAIGGCTYCPSLVWAEGKTVTHYTSVEPCNIHPYLHIDIHSLSKHMSVKRNSCISANEFLFEYPNIKYPNIKYPDTRRPIVYKRPLSVLCRKFRSTTKSHTNVTHAVRHWRILEERQTCEIIFG